MQDTLGTLTDGSTAGPGDAFAFLDGELCPGEVVGRYVIRSLLGEGGMGRVYLVEHQLLGTPHALKVLKAQGAALRERALREARIQASLRHPNVVAVRDVIEVRGHVGLLMDFAPGRTLQDQLRLERPDPEVALRWFRGIARGVREAHRQGIVHRDLKPANVLMVELEGGLEPLVTDFGLARVEGGEDIVREGSAAGSPGYMSPEQLRDASAVDHRSDIFALGCILFELMLGVKAFAGSKVDELARRIAAGQHRRPEDVSPDVSPKLKAALEGSLCVEPGERYADVDALLSALEDAPGQQAPTGRVTFVFTDIEGSTRLWERAPEVMRQALQVHDTCLRSLTAKTRGYEVKHEGDALMLAFSEAAEAVAWCLEAQRALAEAHWPEGLPARQGVPGLRVRMGVHVGEVEAHVDPVSGRADYLGACVNRAARVSDAAHGGQLLLSGEAWDAARDALGEPASLDLGEHQLLGLDGLVRLIELQHPALPPRSFPPPRSVGGESSRPYRGLSRFGPEHAALFFGREAELRRFVERVRAEGMVTLTGPSGTGKSSLIGAGLTRALGGAQVQVVRPGVAPMRALAAAIRQALPEGAWRDRALGALVASPERLGAELAAWALQESVSFVLVVDQAEELLTLCGDPSARESFAEAVVSVGADPALPLRAVLSVREDFFGRLATIRALSGRYSRSVEVLQPPEADQLLSTLVEPAKLFGHAYEDEALPQAMVQAVAGEPAALPLLQACAEQLWEARDRERRLLTWEAYRRLGGVRGALAAHADATLAGLTDAQRVLARRLLLRLVSAQGTRLPESHRDLIQATGAPEQAEIVLNVLINARLLTTRSAVDEDHIELVHEALVTQWGRLRAWLAEDEQGARTREALSRAAAEWKASGRRPGFLWRDERLAELKLWRDRQEGRLSDLERAFTEASEAVERRRRRRDRVLALAVFVVLTALTVLMSWQLRVARSAQDLAESALMDSQRRALVARALSEEQVGRPENAVALLRAADALTPDALGVQALHSHLLRLSWSGEAAHVVPTELGRGDALTVSDDGRWLGTFVDQRLTLVDLNTGAARGVDLRPLLGDRKVWEPALVFSDDGARLVVTWSDVPPKGNLDVMMRDTPLDRAQTGGLPRVARLVVVDVAEGSILGETGLAAPLVEPPHPSPDGRRIVVHVGGTQTGDARSAAPTRRLLIDVDAGLSSAALRVPEGSEIDGWPIFVWSADGEQLIEHVHGDGGSSRTWGWTGGGAPSLALEGVTDVAEHPDGGWLTLRRAGADSPMQIERVSRSGALLERLGADVRWSPPLRHLHAISPGLIARRGEVLYYVAADGLHRLDPRTGEAALWIDAPPPEGLLVMDTGVSWGDAVVLTDDKLRAQLYRLSDGQRLRALKRQVVGGEAARLVRAGRDEVFVNSALTRSEIVRRQRHLCDTETSGAAWWGELCRFNGDRRAARRYALGSGRAMVAERGDDQLSVRLVSEDRVDTLGVLLEGAFPAWATADLAGDKVATYAGGRLSVFVRSGEGWLRGAAMVGELRSCAFSTEGRALLCLTEDWALEALGVSEQGVVTRLGRSALAPPVGAWTGLYSLHAEADGFVLGLPWGESGALQLDEVSVRRLAPEAPRAGEAWVPPTWRGDLHLLGGGRLDLLSRMRLALPLDVGLTLFDASGRLSATRTQDALLIHDGRNGEALLSVPAESFLLDGESMMRVVPDGFQLATAHGRRDEVEVLSVSALLRSPEEVSRALGEETNLRVCRDSLEVVPVLPYPPAETVWAPEERCSAAEGVSAPS